MPLEGASNPSAFPVWALPRWLGEWVEAEALATQTPVDLPAMLGLSELAACAAKKYEVQARDGWVEPLNLYTVTALSPGNRKSAVFRDANKPLREYEHELVARAEAECERRQSRRALLESRCKQAIKIASKDPSHEAEAERLSAECARIKDFELPRLIVDDVTTEKLAVLLEAQRGRIAMLSSEGGIFNIMAGMYSESANFDLYLKSHAGDDVLVDRIGRPSVKLRAPALTMGLTVQPEVVRGLVRKPNFRAFGLLARLLYSMPVSLVGSRQVDPPPVPRAVADAYYAGLLKLLRESPGADDGSEKEIVPRRLVFGVGALRMTNALSKMLEPRMGENGDLAVMADWVSKLAGTVARIAALLHLAESSPGEPIAGGTADGSEPCVTERATAIGFYLLEHAQLAFRYMAADPATSDAKYVANALRRDGRLVLTRRDIFERTKGRFERVALLEPALNLLEQHGYIRKVTSAPNGPGRPSLGYEVNPLWASHNSHNSHNSLSDAPVAPPAGEMPSLSASPAPVEPSASPAPLPVDDGGYGDLSRAFA